VLSSLRSDFNRRFTEEKYKKLLARMDALCGDHIPFRVSETPVFAPKELMERMQRDGAEIISQLMSNRRHLEASEDLIPPGYKAPGQPDHPLFAAVDFGIARDKSGEFSPQLIELQGFPTMFVYQTVLTQQYKEVYDLPRELTPYFGGLDTERYLELFRRAVLGDCDPEQVVLLELDPDQQKTRVDFILTERVCGIKSVNIREIRKEGRRLFYTSDGRSLQVRRLYNRAIADELIRSGAVFPFAFSDELEVEWAGHPNWFFRLSKCSLPFLDHPSVPKTYFLSDLEGWPANLDRWVLKPLFSFAGSGVLIGPSVADLNAVPREERSRYILQEKVDYDGLVESPYGGTKAEFRIMYFWLGNNPTAVNNLVRMGRGKMMGVDHNKNMLWVGSSAGLYLP
jgi:hypothetical protein